MEDDSGLDRFDGSGDTPGPCSRHQRLHVIVSSRLTVAALTRGKAGVLKIFYVG